MGRLNYLHCHDIFREHNGQTNEPAATAKTDEQRKKTTLCDNNTHDAQHENDMSEKQQLLIIQLLINRD